MKVTLERLPESRVQIHIEVEAERVEKSVDVAYRRLAPKIRVPGFRPGKAPRAMTEKYIGRERLMNDAIENLIPDVYNEAIESEDVDAIAQPELDGIEFDPVRLKFIVPVRPSVDLGEYASVRVPKDAVAVTEEMLSEQILLLRRRNAVQVPVDRPIQWNDVVTGDVSGSAEGDSFVEDTDAEFPVREGVVLFVPGLAEGFIGMSKGEEKDLELTMPEDFRVERLANQTANFHLNIKEVKEEQLPDEDDDFAQAVNAEEFPTLEALRERIRKDLTESLEQQSTAKLQQEAVDKLVEGATLEYPRVLVEREIDHLVRDSVGNDQQQYIAYLQRIGQSEADYRESLRDVADLRVKRSLTLNYLAETEGIEVTADEIEEELDKLVAPMGDDASRFRDMFATEEGVSTIRRNLMSRKTLERLTAIASGEREDQPE